LRTRSASAGSTARSSVLGSSTVASALASGTSTARTARAVDGVLDGGLGACALESGLLTARAGGLLSWGIVSLVFVDGAGMMSHTTGALNVVAGAAAGSGSVDNHFDGLKCC